MEIKTTFLAKGYVLGNLWGGGEGKYPSKILKGNSIEDITQQAEAGILDGSIDGGMGYDGLIGACLTVEVMREVAIDGRVYCNVERIHDIIVGNLNEDQEEFLVFG